MKYPDCREVKYLLTGEIRIYDCELLSLGDDIGILRYILEKQHTVSSQVLPKNTQTYACYWATRPYTLYRWYSPQGEHLGDYFNIADQVRLNRTQFEWRDLVVDIFISPQGRVLILDECELPPDINSDLLNFIQQATKSIIRNYKAILNETDILLNRYFQ